MTNSLLQRVNGELCFNLQFRDKTLLISESKCSQLIPEFKKMNAEQKETFLMQAAIFGANPFTVPAEIYPLPFVSGGVTTYAPAISAKKYVEKGIENDWFVFSKIGAGAGYVSQVDSVDEGTTSVITLKDANANVTLNDDGVLEFVNFKKMATITQTTIEWDELAIPDTTKSRHLWIFLEITQAAGNDVELDYIITE